MAKVFCASAIALRSVSALGLGSSLGGGSLAILRSAVRTHKQEAYRRP